MTQRIKAKVQTNKNQTTSSCSAIKKKGNHSSEGEVKNRPFDR